MVPLSEEELRLLEQMERALVAEDPKLASTLRGTTLRARARRRALVASVVFVAGVCMLMAGAVFQQVWVAVAGFVVMLVSAYVALNSWRGQNQTPEQAAAKIRSHHGFGVVDGGRSKKSRAPRPPRSPRTRNQSHGSMMDRLEERWRRRRDQNGY
jgi:Protein of unknown function (DUF3040)